MKKKILFVGLLLSVMCMFTSCLFVYADGEGGYGSGSGSGSSSSYDLTIKNNLSNNIGYDPLIARIYVRKQASNGGVVNGWEEVYTDRVRYTKKNGEDYPLYSDKRSLYNTNDISVDVSSSGTYDVMVFVYYENFSVDDEVEYRYKYNVDIDTRRNTKLYLSDFINDNQLR